MTFVRLVRWLPPAAALVYLFMLVRRLPQIVDQLTWNADYVSVMAIAQSIATSGRPHRAVVIQIGYMWFDLATAWLPSHLAIWKYAPTALAALTVVLLALTARRLIGRYAAVLSAALGAGASSLVLSTELAQSYHGAAWFGAALLGAYVCWLLTTSTSNHVLLGASMVTGVIAGFITASDPLLVPVGDAPFAAAILLAWRARGDQVGDRRLAAAAVMTITALVAAGTLVLAGRMAGFTSSFPRGLTHFVTRQHLVGNVRQLIGGIFEVAGGPGAGSVVGIVLGLLLCAGMLVPLVWLIVSLRGDTPAPLLAVLAFWSASAMFLAAAFMFSDIPADFVETSARYLVPMFFVAAATVPLWAASRDLRAALVAMPAAFFIAANAASVDRDAAALAFEPSFSLALDAPVAFLEQHGLTRGYAAYDEASPMSVKTDFGLQVRPVTEWFVASGDECGPPPNGLICPYAYNSVSDWYRGQSGPTFVLIDPYMVRLHQPPPPELDQVTATYTVGRFTIFVYADDVAAHMGTPERFTRPLI